MADAAADVYDALLREFRNYDRAVDIVSIFEYLFTSATDLNAEIQHFERFPTVGPTRLTPDFTALTKTRRGIVGEISRIALHDNSVDKICVQLGKYAEISELPDAGGGVTAISAVDVVLFVGMDNGLAAVRRIIKERLESDRHFYSPPARPIIVQVSQDAQTQKYNFQRVPDPANGTFQDDDWPTNLRLSRRFDEETLSVPPKYFVDIKAARPMVNDRPSAIYLAILLWSQVFPELALGDEDGQEIRVEPGVLARLLQQRYGRGRRADVEQALSLLRDAGLASRPGGGAQWRIRYRRIRPRDGEQLVNEVVRRVAQAAARRPAQSEQLSLLDDS